MSVLQEIIIDEKELEILSEGFEKPSGQLDQSHFTHDTRVAVTMLNEPLNIFDRSKLSTRPEYECSKPNAVYSCLGQKVYPVVRDIIEMNHSLIFNSMKKSLMERYLLLPCCQKHQ